MPRKRVTQVADEHPRPTRVRTAKSPSEPRADAPDAAHPSHASHEAHAAHSTDGVHASPATGALAHAGPDAKSRTLTRLRRIEGQVRGLQKMVDDERYCADILTQIASVHEALRSVGQELMRHHLRHCAATAIRGSDENAEAMYDELIEMIYKHGR